MYRTVCYVIYGAIAFLKPGLFRWLKIVKPLGETISDNPRKQVVDVAQERNRKANIDR